MTDIDALLREAANEFDMDIYEVHRLAIIFAIFEIDPLKKHGGVYVFGQKIKLNGFGFLHSVPPNDAICDLRFAWKVASENNETARLFLRELRGKDRLDAEDVRLWLEVLYQNSQTLTHAACALSGTSIAETYGGPMGYARLAARRRWRQ